MLIAIHQPNWNPWLPYYEKLAVCDRFIVLAHCQYEKGGFTNRCQVWSKWWTNPIKQGGGLSIMDKRYADGQRLVTTNLHWICAMAMTLGIDTEKIVMDTETKTAGTERIIEICKQQGADAYLANPQAIEAYLDINLLQAAGIRFVPFTGALKKHPLEMFAESGVERTKELFWRAVEKQKASLRIGPESPHARELLHAA